jgi:hypothetical protein
MNTVAIKVASHSNGQLEAAEVVVPKTGLPVNLFVGLASSGKTSLIQMMGGGEPTELPHRCHEYSDTKQCGLYKVVNEGKEYYLLDTPSLSDSMVASCKTFISHNNLNVCGVFFTAPLGERVLECQDSIAVLLEALGGREMVRPIAHWVVTKSNHDSKFNKQRCNRDKGDEELGTFPTLSKHKLGFGCITHGVDNQEDLFNSMVAATLAFAECGAMRNDSKVSKEDQIKKADVLNARCGGC